MMRIFGLFIDRPIAAFLLALAIVAAGLRAGSIMPISALPEIDYPTLQVVTPYPGASARTVSDTVTAPLEKRLGQIQGLANMSSVSGRGVSTITLQFAREVPVDIAAQEVQQGINLASTTLPSVLPYPPTYRKTNPADPPVLNIALTSPTMSPSQLREIAETQLVPNLSETPGVGELEIEGAQRKAIRVDVSPSLLNGLGQSFEAVRAAVANANVDLPKGGLDGRSTATAIAGNDQLLTPGEYSQVPLTYGNSSPLLLGYVARVAFGPEDRYQHAWVDGQEAVILTARRQPGANIIQMSDEIHRRLARLSTTLPPSVEARIISDRSAAVTASIRSTLCELGFAVVLVMFVTWAFTGDIASMVVPAVCIPVTVLMTVAICYTLGFSINNLTLIALAIALGFIVDDAIVVVENIDRHRGDGGNLRQAALRGTAEVGFTIVALSFSLFAVLMPLIFMGGTLGKLFREFAVTLSVSIAASALVSLTLTPTVTAHARSSVSRHKRRTSPLVPMQAITDRYARALDVALRHRAAMFCVLAATGVGAAALAYSMPKNLFPTKRASALAGVAIAAPSSSSSAVSRMQDAVVHALMNEGAVGRVISFAGVQQDNPGLDAVRLQVELKHPPRAAAEYDRLIERLREASESSTEAHVLLRPQQDLLLDDEPSHTRFHFGFASFDPVALRTFTDACAGQLDRDHAFLHTGNYDAPLGREIFLSFDRGAQAKLAVTQQQIDDTLYDAFGQRQISTVFGPTEQYRVVLSSSSQPTSVASLMSTTLVPTANQKLVPLAQLATATEMDAPLVIKRQNQIGYSEIGFDLGRGYSVGEALKSIRAAQARLGLPSNLRLVLRGDLAVFDASSNAQAFLVAAAVFVVYVTLGVLYESFIHPVTILSTLPSATLGALATLYLSRLGLDVIGLIGIVLLVGIVMKNAIMMIDFALMLERRAHLSALNAIKQAAVLRFRPILMTTMASAFGAVPLAFGSGDGSELRQPLGLAIIGGLLGCQLVTLFTTPVVYLSLHAAHRRTAFARIEEGVHVAD